MISDRRNDDRRVMSDRRDLPRYDSHVQVRMMRAGTAGHVLQGELLDASPTGVRLLLDQSLANGEMVLIEVRDADRRCFNLTAKVIWEEQASQTWFRIGCELPVELTNRQHATLREIATAAF